MVNYANGKIYKVVCNITGLIYVGSTTKHYLSDRLGNHTARYRQYKQKNDKKYLITSFKVLENGDFSIILIENYPCETKDELIARERHHIEQLDCINKRIEGRSKKEWEEANKEKLAQQKKEYYENHIDEVKLYKQQFYLDNIEKIKKDRSEKIKCEHCDKCIAKCNMTRHKKLKHPV